MTRHDLRIAMRLAAKGKTLIGRDTVIKDRVWVELQKAVDDVPSPSALVVDFSGAIFETDALMERLNFQTAIFHNATFKGNVKLRATKCKSVARFSGAKFEDRLDLRGIQYEHLDLSGIQTRSLMNLTNAKISNGLILSHSNIGILRLRRAHLNNFAARGLEVNSIQAEGLKCSGSGNLGDLRAKGPILLSEAQFGKDFSCNEGNIQGELRIDHAVFGGGFFFTATDVSGYFKANGTRFQGTARFSRVSFSDLTKFNDARFLDTADFRGAVFGGRARFAHTVFSRDARYDKAYFSDRVTFQAATFADLADFAQVRCGSGIVFDGTHFEANTSLGPIWTSSDLVFSNGRFRHSVEIKATCESFIGERTIFEKGAIVRVSSNSIELIDSEFRTTSVLQGVQSFEDGRDGLSSPGLGPGDEMNVSARLQTIRGSEVGSLRLAGLDLRECAFWGAHGLDLLRIEQTCLLPKSPASDLKIWRHWPWKWKSHGLGVRADRKTIAEEHLVRRAMGRGGWFGPSFSPKSRSAWRTDALVVAQLYRSLRKGLEDSKDVPGASDFYYGEMEMRRLGTTSPFERLLLTIYWAISGYALRGSRALLVLCAATFGLAGAMNLWGFSPSPRVPDVRKIEGLIHTLTFMIPGRTVSSAQLSDIGAVLTLVAAWMLPLFLALILLSLRNRVRR